MNGPSNRVLYRRLAQEARPYWCHFLGILLLGLLSAPLALLAPLPLKIAVDNVLDKRPLPRFLEALLPAGAAQSPGALLGIAVALILAATSWMGFAILIIGKRSIPVCRYVEEKDANLLPD